MYFVEEDVENWTRQVTLLLRKLFFKRSRKQSVHIKLSDLWWNYVMSSKKNYEVKFEVQIDFPNVLNLHNNNGEWNTIWRCSCMQIACQSSTNQIQRKSPLYMKTHEASSESERTSMEKGIWSDSVSSADYTGHNKLILGFITSHALITFPFRAYCWWLELYTVERASRMRHETHKSLICEYSLLLNASTVVVILKLVFAVQFILACFWGV